MAEAHSRRALWMQKLTDEVVRGLSGRIRAGALRTGAALPGVPALMAEFVTSEGVVTRALEQLQAKGLIAPDGQGGWTVARPALEGGLAVPDAQAATIADVLAVLELRIGLDSEAAALAAERRDAAQMAAIRAADDAYGAACEAGQGLARADYLVHLSIAEAANNRYHRDLTDYLGPLLIPRMRVSLGDGPGGTANARAARREHAAVVAAIKAQDPDAARGAMRAHLVRAMEMIRGLDGGETQAPRQG